MLSFMNLPPGLKWKFSCEACHKNSLEACAFVAWFTTPTAFFTETLYLALGSIFLKHKTNKLKPDTPLQRKVSWSVEQIWGFYDAFLYTKYRLKDGKSQEKSSRETMLTNISELWQKAIQIGAKFYRADDRYLRRSPSPLPPVDWGSIL